MLELRDITKRYAFDPAVDRVSFTVQAGRRPGISRAQRCGQIDDDQNAGRAFRPDRGIDPSTRGRNIRSDLVAYKRRLGYVPEQSEIYPHLSGYDYLLLVGRLRGLPEAALREKARAFLRVFDLDSDRDNPIGAYSKGMRQKVLISAALLHDPEILLLDEPLSGLALEVLAAYSWPGNVRELKNLIERVIILTSEAEEGIPITAAHLLSHLKEEAMGVRMNEESAALALETTATTGAAKNLRDARQEFEKDFIVKTLRENDFNVSKCAQILGVERSHLHRKIKSFGIETKE